jgi:hypothetical protein
VQEHVRGLDDAVKQLGEQLALRERAMQESIASDLEGEPLHVWYIL